MPEAKTLEPRRPDRADTAFGKGPRPGKTAPAGLALMTIEHEAAPKRGSASP